MGKLFVSTCFTQMTFSMTVILYLGFCVIGAFCSSGALGLLSDLPEGAVDKGPVVINCKAEEEDDQCQKDKVGYESIIALHRLIDDDTNGYVDLQESGEFLQDELQMQDGQEKSKQFHSKDTLVTVDDLWRIWRGSEVYNWTEEEVAQWLDEHVDLPQYADVFKSNHIDGQSLPRLACNKSPYLSVIGINNPVHKQKLFLKAMDLVLFGVPKKVHNYIKDIALLTLLVAAVGGFWYAYLHNRDSQKQVQKLMKDLESLQKAEDSLKELQDNINHSDGSDGLSAMHYNTQSMHTVRIKDPEDETEEEIERYKLAEAELEQIRASLRRAEKELEHQNKWSAPSQLQCWLQYTHEVEQFHFNAKRHAAEQQLKATKELCDRMKKRNRAFLGSLRMAHSTSLDDIDQRILNARSSLAEVKNDMQERVQRWSAIEQMCGFPIMTNPGMVTLKQSLQREITQGNYGALLSGLGSVEDGDEDLPPSYGSAVLRRQSTSNILCQSRQTSSKLLRRSSHHSLGVGVIAHKRQGGNMNMGSQGSLSRVGLSRVQNVTNGHASPESTSSPSNGHGPVMFNLGENLTPPDLIGQMMINYQNGNSINKDHTANQNPKIGHFIKHSQSYDLASSASESSLTNLSEKRSQSSSALKQMTISEIPELPSPSSSDNILDDSLKKKKKKGFFKLFKPKDKK